MKSTGRWRAKWLLNLFMLSLTIEMTTWISRLQKETTTLYNLGANLTETSQSDLWTWPEGFLRVCSVIHAVIVYKTTHMYSVMVMALAWPVNMMNIHCGTFRRCILSTSIHTHIHFPYRPQCLIQQVFPWETLHPPLPFSFHSTYQKNKSLRLSF